MQISNKAFARGLLVLGLLLLGYSIASTQAITGDVTFSYGDPNLRIQWIMLCSSAIIVVVAFIFLLFKRKKDQSSIDVHSDVQHMH